MTLIKRTNSKTNGQKKPSHLKLAPTCRRCGCFECSCSGDEIDAGGPA